jgi:tetratricopeptide (TPR) repeat protein/predicted Ser/Thr protein kinase
MASLQPEDTLAHYRIIEKIGEGGMGEVYKAEDLKLGRQVAIKLLPLGGTQDDKARERFLREARSASALNHANIVTIHAIDETEDRKFIVMEYVEGESLKARIAQGALDLMQVLQVGSQVSDALDAAHNINLIHRDIKSANILVTPRGQAKVLDFGLAKIVQTLPSEIDKEAPTMAADLTDKGQIVGTVSYMSPEQTRGEALDSGTDIFSLGVVLYEAATGRLPFTGPSLLAIMHDIAATHPPPPSTIKPDLPLEFDLIIERALAKERERRYSSAAELGDALRGLRASAGDSLADFTLMVKPAAAGNEPEAFVGREPEMKKLGELLRQAIGGSGRVVFLTGEPGIGKTSLADEFVRRARQHQSGLLFSRGHCVEQYGPGEAYLPFLDAVGALLAGPGRERIAAVLRTYAPTWCLQLPAAFVSTGSLETLQRETIGATKERMLREMGDALGALTANIPLVLLLEDIHWADPSSIDLLRHLCQRIGGQRLLIIGTFRSEDVERSGHPLKTYKLEMQAHKLCEEISLGMLSHEHIAGYLDVRFAPNDFPRELPALIQRKTEGHPLFATSLVQFLSERGDIAKANEHWTLTRPLAEMELEAPENVRSVIRKKIEALDETDRRALQYASIEGEEFTSTVAATLLQVDDLELEERLDRLDRVHRLIDTRGEEELPDGALATRYRFAHALYQNVLYGDLVSKRRILLHRQAGEQLVRHYGKQAPRIAAQLAMHFERGRDFDRAVEYFLQAGDNAAQLYANDEAEKHYSRALFLVDKLPAEEQTARRFTIYQKRGGVNLALSRFNQAVDDFTLMHDQARMMDNPALESTALNSLTLTLFYSHRLTEMADRAEEALRVAHERAGGEALRVETMQLIGLKHICYGELAEAKSMLDEVIRIARTINHKPVLLSGLGWRGLLHFFQTEYESAEEMVTEARKLASETRDGFLLLLSLFVLGLTRGNLGRISEALTTLNEGIKMGQRNGDRFWFPRLPNCIGWIHRELQDFDHAAEYDQQGLDVGREHHVLEAQANSLINLGIDYDHTGKSAETLATFHEAESIFERDAWFRWRYNIRLQAGTCEHWLAKGDLDQAGVYAGRLLALATNYEARKYIAVAHKLRAEIAMARGDLGEARAELNIALDQLSEYPAPLVAWKTYAVLGRLGLQAGDAATARNAFTQAAAIIKSIAGHISEDRLLSTFLNSSAVAEVFAGANESVSKA